MDDNKMIPISYIEHKIKEYQANDNYMMMMNAFALKRLLMEWNDEKDDYNAEEQNG